MSEEVKFFFFRPETQEALIDAECQAKSLFYKKMTEAMSPNESDEIREARELLTKVMTRLFEVDAEIEKHNLKEGNIKIPSVGEQLEFFAKTFLSEDS